MKSIKINSKQFFFVDTSVDILQLFVKCDCLKIGGGGHLKVIVTASRGHHQHQITVLLMGTSTWTINSFQFIKSYFYTGQKNNFSVLPGLTFCCTI